ncbi:hypothetical protein DXG01_012785 [Tephrocybe rancida]|nr:hypothetical protein DXG01_012785 [Tephrocybe rancida]
MAQHPTLSFQSTQQNPLTSLSDQNAIAVFEAVQSNNLLPDPTILAAQALLIKTQGELIILDDEISRVEALLNGLQLRRRTKTTQIRVYSSASAPLRKLANETLSQIFILCCSDSSVTPEYRPAQQQHILGQVCRKWRQLSITTPQLWSRIDIDHCRHDHGIGPEPQRPVAIDIIPYIIFLQRTTQFCQRSGEVPLSLTFTNSVNSETDSLDPFMPHLWRVVELVVHESSSTVQSLFALPPDSLPSLRSLDLKGPDIGLNGGWNLLSIPTLREFSYVSHHTRFLPWLDKLPLSQLTRLILPNIAFSPVQLLSLLALVPNLTDGAFATDTVGATLLTLPTVELSLHLELPHLHTLRLATFQFHGVEELQRLVFPKLRNFALELGMKRRWEVGWAPTILRSGILETLRLEDYKLSSHEMMHILRATPRLAELELGSGEMLNSSILQKMSTGELVPKLVKLRCLITFVNLDDYGALDLHLDMLEQRREEATPARHIRDVHFLITGDPDAEDAEMTFPGLNRTKNLVEGLGWNIKFERYLD